jgi:hypothetical protein
VPDREVAQMRTIHCRSRVVGVLVAVAAMGVVGCTEEAGTPSQPAARSTPTSAGLPPLQTARRIQATPTTGPTGVRAPAALELDPASIQLQSAYAYSVNLPDEWLRFASDHDDPSRSTLVVEEDGVALGPANVPVETVQSVGRGSFLHWGSWLYFSSSDNTDPRSNGRDYRVFLQPAG